MRIGELFSGYGGLGLGVQAALGGAVVWHADDDPEVAQVLNHHWPHVPNLGDVTTVDWTQVEPVDVLTGGTPCQDVSEAGRRVGMRLGTRSGLWAAMCNVIEHQRPRLVVWENVRGVLNAPADSDLEPCPFCVGDGPGQHLRALGRVLGDLADLGYDAEWCGLRASDVGAPHQRFRVFVAAANTERGGWAGWTRYLRTSWRHEPTDGGEAAAHGGDHGRQGHPQRHSVPVGPGQPTPHGDHVDGCPAHVGGWWRYGPAIERWEQVVGRAAPPPVEPGKTGPRLSPVFAEWMMGLPLGHVTGTQLPGRTQVRILGNGVVPQQAAAAVSTLVARGVGW